MSEFVTAMYNIFALFLALFVCLLAYLSHFVLCVCLSFSIYLFIYRCLVFYVQLVLIFPLTLGNTNLRRFYGRIWIRLSRRDNIPLLALWLSVLSVVVEAWP